MGIGSLACDWLNGHLYWTSTETKSLYAGSADGRGVAVVMAKDGTPMDLVLLPSERFEPRNTSRHFLLHL